MLFVEGITVRNFRSLNSVTIGVDRHGYGKPLTNISCFIGKPNTGKSNFLDVFSFVQEVNSYGINLSLLFLTLSAISTSIYFLLIRMTEEM